ncbi:energy-coupling factor transporter ATPase [Salibacterium aidingense]|uniref:energy-coupling factor transporter ATPase n=1 Tax=Salibacterium aidingense TaxID=384933 RepID=UPI003BE5A784
MEAVTFHHVYYQYEEKAPSVIKGVHATLHQGEWAAVIGANGSGKSTLSRLVNGLLLPSEGTVAVYGQNTAASGTLPFIRRQVGMVFQNPDHQFVAPTVRDDIAFGIENAGIERLEMERRIAYAASQTGISQLLDSEPHRLSGGQKQRAAMAGVLALQPDILVLDEATSMLDPMGREDVMQTIRHLHDEKEMTILSVTHHLHEALQADRVWYMEEGRLVHDWPAEELWKAPEKLARLNMPLPYSLGLIHALKQINPSNPEIEKIIQKAVRK